MSSVLESLAAQAAPSVEATVARWTAYVADGLAAKILPKLPASLQGAFAAAVSELKDNEALLGQASAKGFTALLTHLALGEEDQARMVWLSTAADFDAEMHALDEAYMENRTDVRARAGAWATVKRVALAVLEAGGSVGAKLVIPTLLGLVPL